MTTHAVAIRSLRKGNLFYLDGEAYCLEYLNECRALIRPRAAKEVAIEDRNTGATRKIRAKSEAFSVSHATVVEIRRRPRI